MRFSRTRRLALLAPFGWITRLLSRPEVGNTVYAASSGGGRLGPAAALVGLCLTGGAAGAACMVTGALPAPAIIASVQAPKAASTPAPKAKRPKAAKPKVVQTEPAAARTEPPARTYAAVASRRPPPHPGACRRRVKAKATKTKLAARKQPAREFTFESDPAPRPTAAPTGATASAASTGAGGAGASRKASGGGGGTTKSAKEFGFEGG